jgi:hypothetical protein
MTPAPKLKRRNRAWHLEVNDLTALEEVINWYGSAWVDNGNYKMVAG